MSRKGQALYLATSTPPAGQEVIEIPAGQLGAIDGVLEYFAVVAWCDEPRHRLLAFEALHQWRIKSYIRRRIEYSQKQRYVMQRRLHEAFRPDDGWLEAGQRDGMVYRTMKRLERHLRAGASAWALYRDDLPAFGPNPTTRSGIGLRQWHGGMDNIEQCMRYLAEKQLGPEKDTIPDTETDAEGTRKWDKSLDRHKRLTDNNRRLVWNESLPIAHHCITLHFAFERLGTNRSDLLKLFTLLNNWWWLPDALESAEWWREHLPKHVPFTDANPFDPNKAIILRPLSDEELANKSTEK